MKELAERMIEYRARHGLSQDKLAKMCRVSMQTIWSVEKGQQKPSRLTLAKIEGVIGNDELKYQQN